MILHVNITNYRVLVWKETTYLIYSFKTYDTCTCTSTCNCILNIGCIFRSTEYFLSYFLRNLTVFKQLLKKINTLLPVMICVYLVYGGIQHIYRLIHTLWHISTYTGRQTDRQTDGWYPPVLCLQVYKNALFGDSYSIRR